MYKLRIIKKALNGAEWEPKLNIGNIFYPYVRYYPIDNNYGSNWKPIAKFKTKEDNKVYTLVGGEFQFCDGGLGCFGYGYGDISVIRGLLVCKSKEIAEYFGKTFGKLIFDAIYGQYNNYTWI